MTAKIIKRLLTSGLVISFFLIYTCVQGQTELIEPRFGRIEFAQYYMKKGNVDLLCHFAIDSQGVVETLQGTRSYIILLDEQEIGLLNEIFNGGKKLKEYMVRNKLNKGEYWGGCNAYFSYSSKDSLKLDTFCFIPIFMSDTFNRFYMEFIEKIVMEPEKTEIPNPDYDIAKGLKAILAQHKKSPYLKGTETSAPQGKNPPPPVIND